MKLYFAPMEGITTYIYRNTHSEMFGGCDAYFAPFINPSEQVKVSKKGMKDIQPELNFCNDLKIQVLTNNAQSFLKFTEKIKLLGYDEVNINVGCPASTVVHKGRGAGFLRDVDGLDCFLESIFSECDIKITLKTRIGFYSGEEMADLLEVYNKYPIKLLTVHPRTREAYYGGVPDMEVFDKVYQHSANALCYNGNIFSAKEYYETAEKYKNLDSVMIGRGAIQNPAIFREIKGGQKVTTQELIAFTEKLAENYYNVLQSDVFTLHKMKEIWVYILNNYPEEKKIAKAVKKARSLAEFKEAIYKLPAI